MHKNLPKISIVTPSLNQGNYIEQTIQSVLDQGYPNLEYIIIDGGSTDNSIDIIKKYEKHLAYWISEPDQGQSDAINKGIKKCTGEIFNWICSDDYYEPNALYNVANAFIENDSDLVSFNARVLETDNSTRIIKGNYKWPINDKGYLLARLFQPSTFIKRDVIEKIGFLNTDLHHVMDVEWYLKYFLYFGNSRVKLINQVIVNYRHHEASKSIKHRDKFEDEINLILYKLADKFMLERYCSYLNDHVLSEDIKQLKYEIEIDKNLVDINIIKDALANLVYSFFISDYVAGNYNMIKRGHELIEKNRLRKKYRTHYDKVEFKVKYLLKLALMYRKIKSSFSE